MDEQGNSQTSETGVDPDDFIKVIPAHVRIQRHELSSEGPKRPHRAWLPHQGYAELGPLGHKCLLLADTIGTHQAQLAELDPSWLQLVGDGRGEQVDQGQTGRGGQLL